MSARKGGRETGPGVDGLVVLGRYTIQARDTSGGRAQ